MAKLNEGGKKASPKGTNSSSGSKRTPLGPLLKMGSGKLLGKPAGNSSSRVSVPRGGSVATGKGGLHRIPPTSGNRSVPITERYLRTPSKGERELKTTRAEYENPILRNMRRKIVNQPGMFEGIHLSQVGKFLNIWMAQWSSRKKPVEQSLPDSDGDGIPDIVDPDNFWERYPLPVPDNNVKPSSAPSGNVFNIPFFTYRDQAPKHTDPRIGTCESASDYSTCVEEIFRRVNTLIDVAFLGERFKHSAAAAQLLAHYIYGSWDDKSPRRPALYFDPNRIFERDEKGNYLESDFVQQVNDLIEQEAVKAMGGSKGLSSLISMLSTQGIEEGGEEIAIEDWSDDPRLTGSLQNGLGTVGVRPYTAYFQSELGVNDEESKNSPFMSVQYKLGSSPDGKPILLMTVQQQMEMHDFYDWCGDNLDCKPDSDPIKDFDHPFKFYTGDFTTLEKENLAAPFDIYSQWKQTVTYSIPYTIDNSGNVTVDLGTAPPGAKTFNNQFDTYSNVIALNTEIDAREIQNPFSYSYIVTGVPSGSGPIALLKDQTGYIPNTPPAIGGPGQRSEDMDMN